MDTVSNFQNRKHFLEKLNILNEGFLMSERHSDNFCSLGICHMKLYISLLKYLQNYFKDLKQLKIFQLVPNNSCLAFTKHP